VTAAFQAEVAAAGQQLSVWDIRPLPPGDENGISPLFLFIGLALPSIAFGSVLAGAGRKLPGAARLAALTGFAVLAGPAAAWVADGMVGALTGAPLALAGIGALTGFATSATVAAAWRLAGPPLAAHSALLFVPVGVPAADSPFGASFVTSRYAHLASALPPAPRFRPSATSSTSTATPCPGRCSSCACGPASPLRHWPYPAGPCGCIRHGRSRHTPSPDDTA
jgi:hypothetical protein